MNPWVKKKPSPWTSHPSVIDFRCWQLVVSLLTRIKTLILWPEEQQKGEYDFRNRIKTKCMYNNFSYLIIPAFIVIATSGLTIIQFLNFSYLKPFWLFIYLYSNAFSLCPWKEILSIIWFRRVWFSLGAPPWVTLVYWKEFQVKPR